MFRPLGPVVRPGTPAGRPVRCRRFRDTELLQVMAGFRCILTFHQNILNFLWICILSDSIMSIEITHQSVKCTMCTCNDTLITECTRISFRYWLTSKLVSARDTCNNNNKCTVINKSAVHRRVCPSHVQSRLLLHKQIQCTVVNINVGNSSKQCTLTCSPALSQILLATQITTTLLVEHHWLSYLSITDCASKSPVSFPC